MKIMPQEQPINSSPSFINNPRNRSIIYQIILLACLGYFFYSIIANALTNMEARGIKSGYDFLFSTAGFDVVMSLIEYDATYSHGYTFIVGLLNTLLVSIISIFLATIIGFLVGIAYFSKNWLIRKTSIIYVETFRNIPLLLQVFFWYFAVLAALPHSRESITLFEVIFLNIKGLYLPSLVALAGSQIIYYTIAFAIIGVIFFKRWAKDRQNKTGQQLPVLYISIIILFGFPIIATIATGFPFMWEIPALKGFSFKGGITIIPELIALATALSIYTGAFIAEAVRAGVQSVPKGQTEAARSIGLKESRIMSLIIIPQGMRVIVPILNSEYQSLLKNSTLATAIGYPDLFTIFVGTALNQTGQAIEIVFMTMAVYFVINMGISFFMNRFNSSVELTERT